MYKREYSASWFTALPDVCCSKFLLNSGAKFELNELCYTVILVAASENQLNGITIYTKTNIENYIC